MSTTALFSVARLAYNQSPVISYDAISDSGLWGPLYYTGYLTIESVLDRSMVCVRTIFFIRADVSIVSIYFSNTKWGGHCGMARMGDEIPRC